MPSSARIAAFDILRQVSRVGQMSFQVELT
jgi:hypothetical protein